MVEMESSATVPSAGGVNGRTEDVVAREIARILDECQQISNKSVQTRKLRELSAILLSSSSSAPHFPSFVRALTPLFDAPRRTVSTERVVRFVSSFAVAPFSGDFAVEFLKFLVFASRSAHKTARLRACQIVSEIIMRLPDDADVSDEVWDEVIDSMIIRAGDRFPAVRVFAVRALSRFACDADSTNILDLFLNTLPQEQNAEVRKAIILSLPPTSTTAVAIIDRTLDVNESVRKVAYSAIASKFPLQSLSIKSRTTLLQRGISDRSSSVRKECLKMLKDEWLVKSCNGDPILLLRFLDVETYESVGEVVIRELLQSGIFEHQGIDAIKKMIKAACHTNDGQSEVEPKLIEPEGALYWRIVCRHLQVDAQAKGSDAASTMGVEAAMFASQASISNDLLEDVLPVTVSDYVELVKGHLLAGPNYRFVSRQLLLLGGILDFSDLTNKKVASIFVHELLHRPLEHEADDDGNKILIGDGINLGGDQEWSMAVSVLAKKVHAAAGEFEEVVTLVIDELARPCRERSADFMQWMHCFAVSGFLLENIKSLRCLQGKVMEPTDMLHYLLLAGARHIHADVQRVAARCLGLYGLLELKPSDVIVKQLRLSLVSGPPSVSVMACKVLIDLATWHGTHELDTAISLEKKQTCDQNSLVSVDLSANKDVPVGLLDLLYSIIDRKTLSEDSELDDDTVETVIGEGFAKILLSDNYQKISTSLHPVLLQKLISMYFSREAKDFERLKQCLSVFFEHYPVLSSSNKRCVSRAFIPVMRSMWPGIFGNPGGSPATVSRMRKRATQAAYFMLRMMQTPLLSSPSEDQSTKKSDMDLPSTGLPLPDIDSADEGLALRIGAEVASCSSGNRSAAAKSYVLALCRITTLLTFRPTEQDGIKFMRGLLNCMTDSVLVDKEVMKDLIHMAAHLKALDQQPDKELPKEEMLAIIEKLELDINLEQVNFSTTLPCTPAPSRSRAAPPRRKQKQDDSSDEDTYNVPPNIMTPGTLGNRSQRASKTVAMSRMSARTDAAITESEDDETSELTSVEDSDGSSDE